MEKLRKRTGVLTPLELNYISVQKVANDLNLHPATIWKAMRRGKLKYESIPNGREKTHPKQTGYVRMTTQKWVEEWREISNDKNYQTYNGQVMYRRDLGEMSARDVRDYMGWTKNKFMYHLYKGALQYTQKGYYYVFYREDVEVFKKKMEKQEKQHKQG